MIKIGKTRFGPVNFQNNFRCQLAQVISWKKSSFYTSLRSNINRIGVCESAFSIELLCVSLPNYCRTSCLKYLHKNFRESLGGEVHISLGHRSAASNSTKTYFAVDVFWEFCLTLKVLSECFLITNTLFHRNLINFSRLWRFEVFKSSHP